MSETKRRLEEIKKEYADIWNGIRKYEEEDKKRREVVHQLIDRETQLKHEHAEIMIEEAIADGRIYKKCRHEKWGNEHVSKYGMRRFTCVDCNAELAFYEIGHKGKRYVLSTDEHDLAYKFEWSIRR